MSEDKEKSNVIVISGDVGTSPETMRTIMHSTNEMIIVDAQSVVTTDPVIPLPEIRLDESFFKDLDFLRHMSSAPALVSPTKEKRAKARAKAARKARRKNRG